MPKTINPTPTMREIRNIEAMPPIIKIKPKIPIRDSKFSVVLSAVSSGALVLGFHLGFGLGLGILLTAKNGTNVM